MDLIVTRSKLPDIEREKLVQLSQPTLWDEEGKEALEYLRIVRGFSDDSIKAFKLGYVPHWVKRDNGLFHEFAGRILIPIYNQYDNLIAVSSRDWREGAERKFHHESFSKAHFLFGLNIAKKAILERSQSIIVEGEFDVISLHNRGFTFTVGALGSSLQLYQLAILSRYCSEIYLLFDSDTAGKQATERSVKIGVNNQFFDVFDIKLIPVSLPAGDDPDDFIKKNGVNSLVSLLRKHREEFNKLRGV